MGTTVIYAPRCLPDDIFGDIDRRPKDVHPVFGWNFYRELLTQSYNLSDVASLLVIGLTSFYRPQVAGMRPFSHRWHLGRPDWYRAYSNNQSSGGNRSMTNRWLVDYLAASVRFPSDYDASDANLWHIGRWPSDGGAEAIGQRLASGWAPDLSIAS